MSVGRRENPSTGAPQAMAPELTTTRLQPRSASTAACRASPAIKVRWIAPSRTSVEEPILTTMVLRRLDMQSSSESAANVLAMIPHDM